MNKAFRKLVESQRSTVDEVLQCFGDMPQITRNYSCDMDWLHVLQTHQTDLIEASRMVEGDYGRIAKMRRKLACIVATCEAWERRLSQSCGDEHPPVNKAARKIARCHCRGNIKFPNREPAPVVGLVVKMFKAQFALLVKSGAKLQTVRPTPKRMPKVGQRISLRQWIGKPYRSKQRVLRESVITDVQTIWFDGCTIRLDGKNIAEDFFPTTAEEAFARADGFENLNAMADWFRATHRSLPFQGIVIKWSPTKTP